jgi:DNA repair protein RadC
VTERDDQALLRDILGAAASMAAGVTVGELLEAGPRRLQALGLPFRARRRLLAVAELARRHQPRALSPAPIDKPRDALPYVARLRSAPQEILAIMPLNAGLGVAGGLIMIASGAVAHVAVEPREVFAPALERGASALVLVHNHPSGVLEPSADDLTFTRTMAAAGDVLGIQVLDHLVVARRGYFSFAEAALVPGPEPASRGPAVPTTKYGLMGIRSNLPIIQSGVRDRL